MANDVFKHVSAILEETFKVMDMAYLANDESMGKTDPNVGTRLIFPNYSRKYRNGEKRLSEQELRFCFVEQFNIYCRKQNWNVYYSIETPTEEKYRFNDKGKDPHSCPDGIDGQSAMFDLVIHDSTGNRLCHIEFKAHNPEPRAYKKDFVKLNEESELGIFVQILENADSGTLPNICEKIKSDLKGSIYICHILKNILKNGSTYCSKANPDCSSWKLLESITK